MNNDKTLETKFITRTRKDYPIWYYKELEEVDISYVIAYLLKDSFVVDIDGSKHEIVFGYNEKEEYIGEYIAHDDIKNSQLCSFEVINKGFREGKWFIVTNKDTTDDFKQEYENKKAKHEKEETEELYRHILNQLNQTSINHNKF